jgi:hypothetical protein
MAVVVVRLRAAQPLAARIGQRVDGSVEPELRELLGLSGTRAETGTPKEALGLRLAELSAVNGRHRCGIGAAARGLNARSRL